MQHSIFVSRHCPYKRLNQLQDSCDGVLAIDFYATNQLFLTVFDQKETEGDTTDYDTLFHIILMLFYLQRHGSSCLHLSSLDKQMLWRKTGADGQLSHNGYQFPSAEYMHQVVTGFMSSIDHFTSLVYVDGRLYTHRYYEYEEEVVDSILMRLVATRTDTFSVDVDEQRLLQVWQKIFAESLGDITPQQRAVLNAVCNHFSIITGGAGTGKTYTIARLLVLKCLVNSLSPSDVLLLAPTGKAANRLQESINKELATLEQLNWGDQDISTLKSIVPQTVHKVLRIHPVTSKTPFNEGQQLNTKLVIVDESSMLDIATMGKLIKAIPATSTLVLVGDPHQLPSVNVGSLLAELVKCFASDETGTFTSPSDYLTYIIANSKQTLADNKGIMTRLQRNYRSDNALVTLASSILQADVASLLNHQSAQFQITDIGESNNLSHHVSKLLRQWVVPKFKRIRDSNDINEAWRQLTNYAFLTPYRQGNLGVDAINRTIQSALNAGEGNYRLARGVPIMIGQNDYQSSLFNGDIGLIWPDEKGDLKAWFKKHGGAHNSNDDYKVLSIQTLPNFDVSFAMTIHKTQGSEYQHVDILLPLADDYLLSNELVYTAVTRAKESVNVFTSEPVLQAAVNKHIMRASGIQQMIKKRW